MESGDTQTIRERVLAKVVESDGKRKLACSDALALADELGVAPVEIGSFCNDNDIRLHACQLGCF